MGPAKLNPKARTERSANIFNAEVMQILGDLHARMNDDRLKLLEERRQRQSEFDLGAVPKFIDDHPASKENWQIAKLPDDILDRRVEITGPVNSTKMVINMLSAGPDGLCADMAMLDFEDSMKPTWANLIDGYYNVIGAANENLIFKQDAQTYQLNAQKMAHMMVRIRGLHLEESNVIGSSPLGDAPIAGGLVDLVLCAYHTAKVQMKKKKTPMFYVPKCEHFLEARWWHTLFSLVEEKIGLPPCSLRTTFLIETLPAAFQIEEILYEIRERATGLNGGRWDKIFSDIKVLRNHKDRIMADRSTIDMTRPWMSNYAQRLIKICHAHGAFAMGGMSAFTPGKDPETRRKQSEKVLADKAREASIGHDGCWVSHPFFIAAARAQFSQTNQLTKQLESFSKRPDLLPTSDGPKTLAGLRTNARVAIAYTHGWQNGLGCIALDNLMEDLATLEISRAQIWQWLHHRVTLDDGTRVTRALVEKIFSEECARLVSETGEAAYEKAASVAVKLFTNESLADFFATASELE